MKRNRWNIEYRKWQRTTIAKRLKIKKDGSRRKAKPIVANEKRKRLYAPESLNIFNRFNRRETVEFIEQIRNHSALGYAILLDFTRVKTVYSCGTILLLAEIDRIQRILGEKADIKSTYPKDEIVEKSFQQIGLLKLLNKAHRVSITEEDRNVFYWRYSTGSCVSPGTADEMLTGIKKELPVGYQKVVAGIEEAMTNSVHHAYILSRGDKLDTNFPNTPKRWWLFAQIMDKQLHIVICDLGIGIPETLPRVWKEQVGDLLTAGLNKKERNKLMLERSFVVGRTRTDQKHRGKGLKDIRKAAEQLGGQLRLHSDDVCASFDYRGTAPMISYNGFNQSIMGTVIQWSIPLKTGQDDGRKND